MPIKYIVIIDEQHTKITLMVLLISQQLINILLCFYILDTD